MKVMPSRTRMNNDLQPPDKLADFVTKLTEFVADFLPVDEQFPERTQEPEPEPGLIPHPVPEPVTASVRPERVMCLCASHSDDPHRRYSPELETYIKASQQSMASHGSLTASAHRGETLTAYRASLILDDINQTEADDILESLEGD